MTRCSVDNCAREAGNTRGLCHTHYVSQWRQGVFVGEKMKREPGGKRLKFILEEALPYAGEDCLIWPYARTTHGYPQYKHQGKPIEAHRYVCMLVHGQPEGKLDAAHSCGNGHLGCVNPKHLRWATRKENVVESFEEGAARYGERHYRTKLTEKAASEIIIHRQSGETFKGIASQFGISVRHVRDICAGRRWSRSLNDQQSSIAA